MDRATAAGTQGRRSSDPTVTAPGPRARRGAAVVLLMSVGVLAAALAGPWHPTTRSAPRPTAGRILTPTPEPPPSPDPIVEALQSLDIRPWNMLWLWQTLAWLAVLGLVWVVVRWLLRLTPARMEGPADAEGVVPGQVGGIGPSPDLPALAEGLVGAQAHLRSRLLPADAVIAAWVALEDGAALSGVERDPASTPTEFTVAVLDRTPVDRAATRALLGLYLRARFGDEPVTPADVAAAQEAVRTLAVGLAAARNLASRDDDGVVGDAAPGGTGPGDDLPGAAEPGGDLPGDAQPDDGGPHPGGPR